MSNIKQDDLITEIHNALKNVRFGSVEIFVQDSVVTQITVRNIKKTSVGIDRSNLDSDTSSDYKNNIQTRSRIKINLHS